MKSLNFKETEALLAKYNIPFCQTKLAKNEIEILSLAEEIGYPLVLKIASLKGEHKTDLGLVKTNIKNEEELKIAKEELFSALEKISIEYEGYLIQKEISGREIVLGMKRDLQFGPVLMFGLGGIMVEILKDISFRITPINKTDAIEMIKEIKGYEVLKGFRGKKPVNLDKLADILVSLSNLSLNEKNIEEIDFNPAIANEKEVWVADARVILK
jgi:acetyl-CoA synthetase (ADP-forming)